MIPTSAPALVGVDVEATPAASVGQLGAGVSVVASPGAPAPLSWEVRDGNQGNPGAAVAADAQPSRPSPAVFASTAASGDGGSKFQPTVPALPGRCDCLIHRYVRWAGEPLPRRWM